MKMRDKRLSPQWAASASQARFAWSSSARICSCISGGAPARWLSRPARSSAAAAFDALGAGEPGLRQARTTGSRADRLGPRVSDRASSVLFSRDSGSEVVKDRALSAFSRGWLHGPDAAPTEAQTVQMNAEASIRRRATATAPREPAVDWLELADRRAEAAAVDMA